MSDFIEKIERVIREKKITKLDIWNIDETKFWIGCGKAQLVVTIDSNKSFHIIDPDNCDYITLVEYISSADETILPMLLVFGVKILYKWCQHNYLEGDIVIGITETSYTNDDTTLEWLQHFIDHIQNKRRGTCLLLIIDSYGSQITLPFYNLTTKNKIVLFRLLPHFTHLTQLLDVGVF